MVASYAPLRSRWFLSIGITCSFLALFVAVMVVFYQQANLYNTPNVTTYNATSQQNTVSFSISVQSVAIGTSVTLIASPNIAGFSSSAKGATPNTVGTTFTLAINGATATFTNGSLLSSQTFTPRLFGNTALYPLDSYTADVNVQVYDATGVSSSTLDLSLTVSEQPVPGYSFTWSSTNSNRGVRILQLSVQRSGVGKVYPIFLLVAFWIIAAGITMVTYGLTLWRYRSIDGDYLSMTASMIFALPALRETAPQGPEIGCLLDYASFFWAMLAAVLLFVACLIRYVSQGWPEMHVTLLDSTTPSSQVSPLSNTLPMKDLGERQKFA